MGDPASTGRAPRLSRGWLSRHLLPDGEEPDPRFSLANERTFLAWIRTALALIGGSIAVEAFAGGVFVGASRTALSLGLGALGFVAAASAGVRWLRVERAMRARSPLPVPAMIPVLAGGVTAGVVLALAIVGAHGR